VVTNVAMLVGFLSVALQAQPAPQPVATATLLSEPAPISVRSCSVSSSRAGAAVWVTFMNDSRAVADDIRIRVASARSDAFELTDRGTFSPDVAIAHVFRPPTDRTIEPARRIACSVSYAHFEDNETWSAKN
jgi:hypothetical protein